MVTPDLGKSRIYICRTTRLGMGEIRGYMTNKGGLKFINNNHKRKMINKKVLGNNLN